MCDALVVFNFALNRLQPSARGRLDATLEFTWLVDLLEVRHDQRCLAWRCKRDPENGPQDLTSDGVHIVHLRRHQVPLDRLPEAIKA